MWNKCDDGELDDLDLEGFCKSMRMYFAAGTLYIVLDVVSMCLCATAILLIILDLFNQDKLINLSIFFVWDTVFWHVMSYIAWACMVNLKFNGDCDELSTRDNLEMGNVCAGPGARLALFTIFYASAVAGTHTFIYYKFRVKKASPESESPENIKSMSITDPKHLENIQNN